MPLVMIVQHVVEQTSIAEVHLVTFTSYDSSVVGHDSLPEATELPRHRRRRSWVL